MADVPRELQHRAERRLVALARRQAGVFTLAQAAACGVSARAIQRRHLRGRYERLWPGVFGIAGAPDGRERRQLAALLLVDGDAALARRSAAGVHGLEPGLDDDGIHLVVRNRTFASRPGLTIHRSRHLTPQDVTEVRSLRVTSVAWTVTDLAGELEPDELRPVVGAAVRRGATDASELRALLARRYRFAGRAALRRVLDELSPLEAQCRSELEAAFVRLTTAAGIPPTAMNHPVTDTFGVTRYLDAVYLPERLPVELDSRAHHGTLLDWHDDLRRENAVVLAGWRDVVRFSHADLRDRPDEVVAVLRRALAQARAA